MRQEKKQSVPNERLRDEREKRGWTRAYVAEQLNLADPKTIGRWERGVSSPNAHFRRRLCTIFQLEPQQLGLALGYQGRDSAETRAEKCPTREASIEEGNGIEARTPTYWSVPYQHNSFFTGREALLAAVDQHLHTEQAVVLSQAVTLHGLGGIGKTQVALEYAYQYGQRYQAVFWIEAETEESLQASFLRLANILELPERLQEKQERVVAAVQCWLSMHPNWLLIWDNVEEIEWLLPFLPSSREGKMLFTTRLQTLGAIALNIEIPTLPLEQGVALLLKRARLLNINATLEEEEQLKTSHPDEYQSAVELSRLLDGLPLALDQAGAYLEETGCRIANYLRHFRQQRKRVLQRRGSHAGMHPASVVTTLALAVKRVEQEHTLAAGFLRLCAFLYPENIPEEIFTTGAIALGPAWEELGSDLYQFDLLLAAVRRASLIKRDARTRMLSLHRLVQAVLIEEMGQQERDMWQRQTICLLNAVFPAISPWTWKQCEQLLPHLLMCAAAVPEGAVDPDLAEILRKAADYLRGRARFAQAEPLYQRALRLEEQMGGLHHLRLIDTMHGLSMLYWEQGRYAEAEPLGLRALSIWEQAQEAEPAGQVRLVNGLAMVYFSQGKYAQAEQFFQRSLHLKEQRVAPTHPGLIPPLSNLADVYTELGKDDLAEPLYQRAIQIYEQAAEAERPLVAYPLCGLARLYSRQDKDAQAQALYQRALHIREQVLGIEHPYVAEPLTGLGIIAFKEHKYDLAEDLYQRALHIAEQALGISHPEVAIPLTYLADLFVEQGKYEQAEIAYRRALRIREQALGASHPLIAPVLKGLTALTGRREKHPFRQISLSGE